MDNISSNILILILLHPSLVPIKLTLTDTGTDTCQEVMEFPTSSTEDLEKDYYRKYGEPPDDSDYLSLSDIRVANSLYMSGTLLPCGGFPKQAEKEALKIDEASDNRIARRVYPGIVYIHAGNKLCAGVVICKTWVLTGAECVSNIDSIIAGTYDFKMESDFKEIRRSSYEIFYETYNSTTRNADIGLVKLDKTLEYTNFIRPICVPSVWIHKDSTKCYHVNWGKYDAANGGLFDHLSAVPVQLLSAFECHFRWTLHGLSVTEDNICGIFLTNSSLCSGDTAGPVLCEVDGVYHVVGITSSIDSMCTTQFFPDLFTAVSYYEPWITKTVFSVF